MNARTCRTCGEALKEGYFHKHGYPTLALVNDPCDTARRDAAIAAFRAARRETEVA